MLKMLILWLICNFPLEETLNRIMPTPEKVEIKKEVVELPRVQKAVRELPKLLTHYDSISYLNYGDNYEQRVKTFSNTYYGKIIIYRESRGDSTAINHISYDYGMYQINRIHWQSWGVDLSKWVYQRKFVMSMTLQNYYLDKLLLTHSKILEQYGCTDIPYWLHQAHYGIGIAINRYRGT